MFKIFNQSAPPYMMDEFRLVRENHHYVTRASAANFILPGANTAGKNSLRFSGAKLWNSLPTNIKQISNTLEFKSKVKAHLFSQLQNREVSDFVFYQIIGLPKTFVLPCHNSQKDHRGNKCSFTFRCYPWSITKTYEIHICDNQLCQISIYVMSSHFTCDASYNLTAVYFIIFTVLIYACL